MKEKIDFVLIWVDGNDKEWQKEKNKYLEKKDKYNDINRWRDWDNLRYWFRGVEKFAPWVNKIHFITYGHLPKWLNTDHPKINIVKHQDYIPEEYLPTFSANPIELNFHRISDLEEKFIFFNDDMFLINELSPEDYFVNGKVVDRLSENTTIATKGDDVFAHILLNDIGIINKHFDKKTVFKENFFKWFNFKNTKGIIKTICLKPWKYFIGMEYSHLPNAYTKSTYREVWEKEYEILDSTSKNKFRTKNDVNQFIFEYWQLASGKFEFRKKTIGECLELSNDNIEDVCRKIKEQKMKVICLNDSNMEIDFENLKEHIKNAFEEILPEKSKFEL